MKIFRASFLALVMLFMNIHKTTAAESSVLVKAREKNKAFSEKLMETILADKKSHPMVYALTGLYTGKNIEEANGKILGELDKALGNDKEITVKGATSVKWQMRTWLRIYYLFNDKSKFFPGRLNPDIQKKMEELFFLYGCGKSTLGRANPDFIWFIQGSENHDMMDLSNAYLALQAVKDKEKYKNKKLPDGHTPEEHVKAWEEYYAKYALERAKNGLFVEISPTYGKWFIGELVNMYEFAESATVRKRMELLINLTWADWAIDQLHGVRGGGKTRCYQGNYSQLGGADSWDRMGKFITGIEGWNMTNAGIQSQLIFSTSTYRLPEIVLDIALNKGNVKPFVYKSTRPAKLTSPPKEKPKEKGYWMDGKGGKMVRYSYCMPEAVMGSWILDTRLDYARINTQNRWQGVIFSTGPDSRVFPQSVGLGNGKTYNQHIAVQRRNAMIVMKHPKAKQSGPVRVFFPKEIKDKIVEKDGWVIVKEGTAWLGVKILDSKSKPEEQNYEFKSGKLEKKGQEANRADTENTCWLWPKEDNPAFVFVVSNEDQHKSQVDFLKYLQSHKYSFKGPKVKYSFTDDLGKKVSMELSPKLPIPLLNGNPVELQPKKVFDSPFMNADYGSGIVTISKEKQKTILDFSEKDKK